MDDGDDEPSQRRRRIVDDDDDDEVGSNPDELLEDEVQPEDEGEGDDLNDNWLT
jgi:hypothetical protein